MQKQVSLTKISFMKSLKITTYSALALSLVLVTSQASADGFFFSTGNPDGKIATLSRPASLGKLQTETADDFLTTQSIVITQAIFTGLLPAGSSVDNIGGVEIEMYHVFPRDSV